MTERDPVLRRVERDAVVACAVMSAAAWAMTGRRLDTALGVIGGGLIVAVSYRGIKGGIDALVGAMSGETSSSGNRRAQAAIGLVKFFTRYAILAVAAYVIMARLRLPPVAVFAGASSLVVAIAIEAARALRHKSPGNV
jgi:hypothetical protein